MQIVPPLEAAESRVLMQYMKLKGYKFTHIKNETGRAMSGKRVKNWQAVWDSIDGVSKGFPDFMLIANGLLIAIELKRIKGSRTSPEQLGWIEALNEAGIPAEICLGADAAIKFIERTIK